MTASSLARTHQPRPDRFKRIGARRRPVNLNGEVVEPSWAVNHLAAQDLLDAGVRQLARCDMPHPIRPKILVVLHQECSTPARIGQTLMRQGFALDIRRPRFGDPLPTTMAGHAGAVIFGGPMSANDNDDFVRREIDWIGVPLRENKPFLGVCLGAQMMARHLGQRVYRPADGCVEAGYYPLKATAAAGTFAAACGAALPSHVYQWHGEGFDLPRGGTLLAEGEAFPVQFFRYGRAYAMQFHAEMTYALMCRWIARGDLRLSQPNAKPRESHYQGWYEHGAAVAHWLDRFLRFWSAAAGIRRHRHAHLGRAQEDIRVAV